MSAVDDALAQVRADLKLELYRNTPAEMVKAIERLIDVKITLAVEDLADRVQDGLGVRP